MKYFSSWGINLTQSFFDKLSFGLLSCVQLSVIALDDIGRNNTKLLCRLQYLNEYELKTDYGLSSIWPNVIMSNAFSPVVVAPEGIGRLMTK
jgi:hypothetical protein